MMEGEPGIFPDPVARVFRSIGRIFGRRGDPPPSSDGPDGSRGGGGEMTAEELADLDPRADGPERRPD